MYQINTNVNFFKFEIKDILEECKLVYDHYKSTGLIIETELKNIYCKFIDKLFYKKFSDDHFEAQTLNLNTDRFKDLKIDHFVNLDTENKKLDVYFGKKIENESKLNYPENTHKNTSNKMKQILLDLIKNNSDLKNKLDNYYKSDIDYLNKNFIIVNDI